MTERADQRERDIIRAFVDLSTELVNDYDVLEMLAQLTTNCAATGPQPAACADAHLDHARGGIGIAFWLVLEGHPQYEHHVNPSDSLSARQHDCAGKAYEQPVLDNPGDGGQQAGRKAATAKW